MATMFGKSKVNATDLAVIKGKLDTLVSENQTLSGIIIKQDGVINSLIAIVSRIDASFTTVIDSITDIKERSENIEAVVFEQLTTNHVGKKAVMLDAAIEEVKLMTNKEIRQLIRRAAKNQPKGYNTIYNRLIEISDGTKNVFYVGETAKGAGSEEKYGIESACKNFMNTIFAKGWQYDAAVIAKDMIRNK